MNGRSPLVGPPRFAQGGGAARPFGPGAPGIAAVDPNSRAALFARQVADNERGRFTERIFVAPPFDPLSPGGPSVAGASQSKTINVTTNRSELLRLVALRGILANSDSDLTGLETANLLLSVSINGLEELTTQGSQGGPVSIATLCASNTAPWFWFAAPPLLRNGDTIEVTVTNNLQEGANLTPEVSFRLVDDEWWQALYGT